MHIGLLSEHYPPDPGGLAVSAQRLARLLVAAGHRVTVQAPAAALPPGQTAETDDAGGGIGACTGAGTGACSGVRVQRFGASRKEADTLADWLDLLRGAHAQTPFDLLHAYYVTAPVFIAVYVGRLLDLPSVVSTRGNDLDRAVLDGSKAGHILYTLAHAGAITANSQDLARKAAALAPGRTAVLIPNGVDTALFAPAEPDLRLRAGLGLDERPVVGFAGEARAKKGLGILLLACRELARHTPLQVLLVGGVRPGDDADLVAVFRKQNPGLPVSIVPHQPATQLAPYYNLFDVLALPSLHDGLPNALLEGMACGRAVAAACVGGIPDVLRDGENGLLFPPGDETACATGITALLGDADLRSRLGRAARATVEQHHSPQSELAANLEVYRGLVGSGA